MVAVKKVEAFMGDKFTFFSVIGVISFAFLSRYDSMIISPRLSPNDYLFMINIRGVVWCSDAHSDQEQCQRDCLKIFTLSADFEEQILRGHLAVYFSSLTVVTLLSIESYKTNSTFSSQ